MNIRVRDYERVVFFTGAGMSAESGVPTYRGQGGIWKSYDYQSCACQEAFERDPEYVWEFHNYRRELVSKCDPNPGHKLIARCQAAMPNAVVVTQNIDGLHQRAGSKQVYELHGSLWRTRCDQCGSSEETHDVPLTALHCATCGTYKRPDIVWFGDSLDVPTLQTVERLIRECDLLISVGTSAVVYPAADMPRIAQRRGATLVEINPESTPISHIYQHHMRTTASEALAVLCEGL